MTNAMAHKKINSRLIWVFLTIVAVIVTVFLWQTRQDHLMKQNIAEKLPVLPITEDLTYKNCTVLMYHHLAPAGTYDGTKDAENGAILSVENFEEQMKYLQENGYHTIFFSELLSYLNEGKGFPPKTVVVTFDDGYESNYVYAYPILQKYGLKGTIHVVVSSSEGLEDRTAENPYQPNRLSHLTMKQIKEMSDSGVIEIGSHTYAGHGTVKKNAKGEQDGFLITRIYEDGNLESEADYLKRITDDLQKSKAILEQVTGKEIVVFAYPYGKASDKVKRVLEEVGFMGAVTVKAELVEIGKTQRFAIPRINVGPNDTLEDFIAKLPTQ